MGLEVARGLPPLPGSVGGQAGQLAHSRHARALLGDGFDSSRRILVATAFKGSIGRLGLLDQALPVEGGGHVGGIADFRRDLGR